MKAAIIENGKVVNIARIADAEFAESQGWIVSDTAKIGDSYDADTGEFVSPPPPPEPVPQIVSRFQARAALHQAGLLAQVQAIMEDPETDPMIVMAWQDATEFRRTSPTVASLAGSLGLDDAALDDLFRQAITIEA